MSPNQKVKVNFLNHDFEADIVSIQSTNVIVKPLVWEQWMNEIHNCNLDPAGCLVVAKYCIVG